MYEFFGLSQKVGKGICTTQVRVMRSIWVIVVPNDQEIAYRA